MPIAVTPISSVLAAQGVHGDVGFQTGSVVSARVLKLLPDNQVRISIGNVAIDVQSEVPLQAGQVLQLAVSQTADGVRLAVVAQQPAAGNAAPAAGNGDPLDTVTLAPGAPITLTAASAVAKVQLTALEALAVSTATQVAATQQAGLSTLFANVGAAASLPNLPPQLQQAVADLLAQRPPLDQQLTGDEVKSAFQKSGLFLESSLASGAVTSTGAAPDLKAALIVFRQVLTTSLGNPAEGATLPAVAESGEPVIVASTAQPAAAATLVPSLTPGLAQDDLLQQAGLFAVEDFVDFSSKATITSPAATPTEAAARNAAAGAALSLLQEALQFSPKGTGSAASAVLDDSTLLDLLPGAKTQSTPQAEEAQVARNAAPPPPLRGALPTAQPVALATLPANAPLASTVHHLLADTDAALARQTLMQVASLPDSANPTMQRLDPTAPRWNFEIPFAMPNGTAVAQFEISRDGGNDGEAGAAQRVWRARFSLDVEPAGPVHALVSLVGDKTSVRMWAERPSTAQQLQAGVGQLSQALVRAELKPGDIVIREGAPVQPAPASAGHFLDRAL